MAGRKGIFVTFEGNEGSGKTTQIKRLYRRLKREGRKVFLTREPGGTAVSDAIRAVLLDNRHQKMTPLGETLLYMASRAELVDKVIRPKLAEGYVVLCDRWLDATTAYQGYGGGVDVSWIRALGEKVTGGMRPDLTIYLDLPLRAGLWRATSHKKADRMERKTLAFHTRVKKGYEAIARREPRRFVRLAIGERESISTIGEKILDRVRRVL